MVNMDTVAREAKAALDEYTRTKESSAATGNDNDYGDFVLAESHIEAYAADWLHALLDERERLLKVVKAAEAWWKMPEDISMDEVILICDTLEESLDVYRATSVPQP